MPKKSTATKSGTKSGELKSKGTKKQVVEVQNEESDVEDVEDVEKDTIEDVVTVSEEKTDSKKRVVPTKESIIGSIDELLGIVDAEILQVRESNAKSKGVKFLRSVNKKLKILRSQASRVIKNKGSNGVRKQNTNSGFLKPVKISKEMAKFAGWNPDELKSRVDVTKYICNYIKEHDLQNPEDRRQIQVDKDPKLRKLLSYDSSGVGKPPLTYYRLQSCMKDHFIQTSK